uniref:transcription factor MYB119-like n=1 Tax=Erigeron canadensis TaxID=72917 RepID=UPI001CB97579|nr:transcription factor MYB119-like [Erigeron canadensis]
MEGCGGNGSHDYSRGNGLTKNPNAQTFPLDSPSWYTPTQFGPQNFKNHQGTFFPSITFGEFSFSSKGIDNNTFQEDGVVVAPFAMDQNLGVDCMFQDKRHCTSPLEQVKGYTNINFTNGVINFPNNSVSDNCPITPRNYSKRLWTTEEDSKLCKLVDQFGTKNWAVISDYMDGRAGKQCRERWYNNLRPDIKADDWSEEEERILVEAHERMGNKWSKIVKLLPGRTENAIKNHWNAAIRKKTMRIKSKKDEPLDRKPKSTILRDYIRGIASTSTNNNNAKTNFSTNVTKGNVTTIPPADELLNSSYCFYSPAIDDLVPSFDDESTFFQNLFQNGTTARQHEITKSIEPLVLSQEPQPHLIITNPQEFNGHSEYGSSASSSVLPNGPYFPMGEPISFFNSSNLDYGYGDINMDLGHVWKN